MRKLLVALMMCVSVAFIQSGTLHAQDPPPDGRAKVLVEMYALPVLEVRAEAQETVVEIVTPVAINANLAEAGTIKKAVEMNYLSWRTEPGSNIIQKFYAVNSNHSQERIRGVIPLANILRC